MNLKWKWCCPLCNHEFAWKPSWSMEQIYKDLNLAVIKHCMRAYKTHHPELKREIIVMSKKQFNEGEDKI